MILLLLPQVPVAGAVTDTSSVAATPHIIDGGHSTSGSSDLATALGAFGTSASTIDVATAAAHGVEAETTAGSLTDLSSVTDKVQQQVALSGSPSSISSALGFALIAAHLAGQSNSLSTTMAATPGGSAEALASSSLSISAIAGFPSGFSNTQSGGAVTSMSSVGSGVLAEKEVVHGAATSTTDAEGTPTRLSSLLTGATSDASAAAGRGSETEQTASDIVDADTARAIGKEKLVDTGSAVSDSSIGALASTVTQRVAESGKSTSASSATATATSFVDPGGASTSLSSAEGIDTAFEDTLSAVGESTSTSDVEDREYVSSPLLPTRVLVNQFRTMEFA